MIKKNVTKYFSRFPIRGARNIDNLSWRWQRIQYLTSISVTFLKLWQKQTTSGHLTDEEKQTKSSPGFAIFKSDHH